MICAYTNICYSFIMRNKYLYGNSAFDSQKLTTPFGMFIKKTDLLQIFPHYSNSIIRSLKKNSPNPIANCAVEQTNTIKCAENVRLLFVAAVT